MFCSCRKNTAWLSRSENRATSTLAPVTSLRPDDWTWIAARWMTRWKPGGRLGVDHAVDHQAGQIVIQEVGQAGPQPLDLDRAGLEHGHRVLVLGQRHEQMLEGRVFVLTGIGQGQAPDAGSSPAFATTSASPGSPSPALDRQPSGRLRHSFSIVHCSGCWFWRANSITWATLVSATSKV